MDLRGSVKSASLGCARRGDIAREGDNSFRRASTFVNQLHWESRDLHRIVERAMEAYGHQRLSRIARVVVVYLTGQGIVQAVNLSVGLLLLRWLSIVDYAQFSVAFGFQTTLGMLTDLGFSGTIVALVGPRGNDPDVLGAYIRSGRHMRNLMLVVLTPLAAIVYALIVREHHWSVASSVLLFLSIVSSISFSGTASYYGTPLLIKRELAHYYRHQLAGGAFRIVCCGALYVAGGLNAWSMSWINSLGFLVIGMLNERESRAFVQLPRKPLPEITRQMMRYVLPTMPSLVFFALQGQIAMFLISFFGQTRSIAEVGALSRLGQILLLLSGFNGTVIEPYFARLPKERVPKNFAFVLVCACLVATLLCIVGFATPRVLLFLLGAKYSNLEQEVGWLVLGSCCAYVAGVVWIMNTARRWIYWSSSWVTIGATLISQIIFLATVNVDSTQHAVYFSAITSAANLFAMLYNSAKGFLHGPRLEISGLDHPEVVLLDPNIND